VVAPPPAVEVDADAGGAELSPGDAGGDVVGAVEGVDPPPPPPPPPPDEDPPVEGRDGEVV
jgi:hypothetical protein